MESQIYPVLSIPDNQRDTDHTQYVRRWISARVVGTPDIKLLLKKWEKECTITFGWSWAPTTTVFVLVAPLDDARGVPVWVDIGTVERALNIAHENDLLFCHLIRISCVAKEEIKENLRYNLIPHACLRALNAPEISKQEVLSRWRMWVSERQPGYLLKDPTYFYPQDPPTFLSRLRYKTGLI